MAGFDFNDFFVSRPLRWAFGQLFGSKAKAWYDENMKAAIAGGITSGNLDYNQAIAKFVDSDYLDKAVLAFEAKVGVPSKYRSVAKEFLKSLLIAQITAALSKIKK